MPSPQAPVLGVDGLILEGIVTTLNDDGSPNISPMGPLVNANLERLWLRPFRTSTTYRNLKRTGCGVFHITDDVELLAQAAVGQPAPAPSLVRARAVDGVILADACRWYAFEVEFLDDSEERTNIASRIVDRGTQREFLGFNRAKHAVIEAAILATRVHLLPGEQIRRQFEGLRTLVEKTGSAAEQRAFDFLVNYVEGAILTPTLRSDAGELPA